MELAMRIARIGNKIVSAIVSLFIILMLLYGGYSLWDTAMLYKGAFASDTLLEFKPSLEDAADAPTLEELVNINSDVCAWLTIDDTHIDYPVVHGKDDMEYINKNVFGEFSLSGSIFMAAENAADFSDNYLLVYGHHMENGAMFGDVMEFVDKSYFEAHPMGIMFTTQGDIYEISLFACIKTDAYDGVVYYPAHQAKDNIRSLLERIEEKAVCYRAIGIEVTDKVIGLSTCDTADTNGRIVLFGKLTKIEKVQKGGS